MKKKKFFETGTNIINLEKNNPNTKHPQQEEDPPPAKQFHCQVI